MTRGARLAAVLVAVVAAVVPFAAPSCGGPAVESPAVESPAIESIGRPGTGDGEFRDPRGVAVSDRGLAVLDRTGRMQVFGLDGRWRRTFTVVPGDVRRGLPTGAVWLPGGHLLVAHTHQSRLVEFTETGETVRVVGEYGVEPGRFLFPQRVSIDGAGDYVVSEYGFDTTNRVQVLRPDGTPVRVLGGGPGAEGGLGRPMGAVPLPDGRTVVADEGAGLVAFGPDGRSLGRFGPAPGENGFFRGICRADDGDVYVVDGGRHELLRLAADGSVLGVLGRFGDPPGGFREPWDVAWHAGRVYVADMGNHRVARIDPRAAEWRRP